jgi:beta-galactosidase
MWMDVKYEPGVGKVGSIDNGKAVAEEEVHTAGKPYQIVLDADRKQSLLMAMIYLCPPYL